MTVKKNAWMVFVPRKSEVKEHIWQRAVLAAFIASTRGLQRLPRKSALKLGRSLGGLISHLDRRRRHYAECNLRLAFGDSLTPSQNAKLVRGVFEHWGLSTIEFLRGPAYDAPVIESLVSVVEGREYLDAVANAETGYVIVTGHLGNFEFLGRWMAVNGYPSTALTRTPGDSAFAEYVRSIREFGGNLVLPKGAPARELLAVLKRKQSLTIAADQNSGDMFIPFFGTPAGTAAGPATLALRCGVPILPAFCLLEPDDSYRILFLPPITTESTGKREADVLRITTAINVMMEEVIRRDPAQWLWLHHRWKSSFEEKNRSLWPKGHDFDAAWERWKGKTNVERPDAE